MPEQMTPREIADETWYWYLNGKYKVGLPQQFIRRLDNMQRMNGILPAGQRCIACHAPLSGAGS